MNGALLLCAASVALPITVMEVRRKWRDLHRPQFLHGTPQGDSVSALNDQPVRIAWANPTVETVEPGKAGNGVIVPHGEGWYIDAGRSSCGTIPGPSA